MLFKKYKKLNRFIGLDITTTTIKLLELSKNKHNYHVENFAIVKIKPDESSIESLLQHNASNISKILIEQLHLSQMRARFATIALADHNIMNKVVRFDKSCTADEIENQIAMDYMKYFAPINEAINYDFHILGNSPQANDCIDVWIIAVKQLLVKNCITAITQSGLQIKAIDLASLAIARSCRLMPPIIKCLENKQLFAILNVTINQSTVIIYHNCVPLLTRTILFEPSLNEFTTEINDKNSLLVATLSIPQQNFVIQQTLQILQSFHASYQINTIKHLLLCGDISDVVAFSEQLNAKFGIPCSVANPFNNMSFAECCDSQTLLQYAQQWMICSGLAMRMSD
jgi:type IV pilus assembly protein PilM